MVADSGRRHVTGIKADAERDEGWVGLGWMRGGQSEEGDWRRCSGQQDRLNSVANE